MNTMNDTLPSAGASDTLDAARPADAWQRRFGVPWERVERAVRAVSDRAVAASRRKFSSMNDVAAASGAHPG